MAKKIKRKVSQVAAPANGGAEVFEAPVAETSTSAAPRTYIRRTPATTEFNPDYTYVIKDLKRIGTLAGTFFVILIVLSFIIN